MSSTNDGSSHAATRAFWITAAGEGRLLNTLLDNSPDLSAAAAGTEVTVQSLYSGVSRGTESLVFHGPSAYQRTPEYARTFSAGRFPLAGQIRLCQRWPGCQWPQSAYRQDGLLSVSPINSAIKCLLPLLRFCRRGCLRLVQFWPLIWRLR